VVFPVHTATIVQDWLTAHSAQVLCQLPYLLELVPADFLFWRLKDELASVFAQNTLKKE
jgi:hypothetical protein